MWVEFDISVIFMYWLGCYFLCVFYINVSPAYYVISRYVLGLFMLSIHVLFSFVVTYISNEVMKYTATEIIKEMNRKHGGIIFLKKAAAITAFLLQLPLYHDSSQSKPICWV